MASRLQNRLESQQQQGIDLSPLLDVVFILLIFFIVTTVFVKETGVEVDKPQAVSAIQIERNMILIAITNDGAVMYDGANIGVAGVQSSVEQALAKQAKTVVIQTDKTVPASLLLAVIDQAKLAGAADVSLAAEQP